MYHNQGGLYRPEFERDNCGFGLIAQMDGEPSHWLISTAISALARLTHRGAVAADGKTGDGCGLLMAMPDVFMRRIAKEQGYELADQFATGLVFLSKDAGVANKAKETLNTELEKEGLHVAGWRELPLDESALGERAKLSLPLIEQIFINYTGKSDADFERKLFLARRRAEKQITKTDDDFYVPSLSSKVILYKGLVMPKYLHVLFKDLNEPDIASALCLFHQRFSTNTLPQWRLAQPFRYLAHNGEINTIKGNRNWALARGNKLSSKKLPNLSDAHPFVNTEGSDSMSFDNMLEVLLMGGMDIFKATQTLMPPAWQNAENIDPDLKAFYRFQAMHAEPWDGPAGVVLTDGRYASCALDRNGLRPARYVITKDRIITLASEVGVYDYKQSDVVEKGRLKPGQMMAVDTQTGTIITPNDIHQRIKSEHPYKQWLKDNVVRLKSKLSADEDSAGLSAAPLKTYQKMFQVSNEERIEVIKVLAEAAQEATGSMGDDTPMAVLSTRHRNLSDYFRQQFAQVTNPPVDPLREQIVMSLETYFGTESSLFEPNESMAKSIIVDSPLLSTTKYNTLIANTDSGFASEVIDITYADTGSLADKVNQICVLAEKAVAAGKTIIVLSDRNIEKGRIPVQALLATGAVHHHLTSAGLRCNANIVVDTGSTRDSHQFAVLIGYGATAIHPYLAYETIANMVEKKQIIGDELKKHLLSYRKGINKGLYKIISKMGISTIHSYRGAQLFEAVGLSDEIINKCFVGTISRIQGSRFSDLENDQRVLAAYAWDPKSSLDQGGLLKFIHGGEYHAYNPDVVNTMHAAVESGDYSLYQKYADTVNHRKPMVLRDLLGLREDIKPIDIDKVESWKNIVLRFDSAGMSLGALSPEAHESLAQAMNALGGRSNSGEGGEDSARFGTNKMSKIKQIASGRFGVTPHYLVNAEVLQIKVAQGAKPGEGGQLPGDKVNALIAKLRHSRPGVALISPPPHHDIYSIEDLAQLIFDLKQVNPSALVSVKLVAEAGVGTIAAGVAKAYADLITISGYDGGTAASPLTSVRYAGSPWELGLTEAHQTLRANDLRDKVRLQTDGGLKTGLDVIKAAILGAESFGFGTGPMVALGCKFLRICHLNNCATGVATQHNILRQKHYVGTAERAMNYFMFIAMETREWMAKLGVSKLSDLIGRTDLLLALEGNTDKQHNLDLSQILSDGNVAKDKPQFCVNPHNEPYDKGELAEQMLSEMLPAIKSKKGGEFNYQIKNIHRSIGARISGEIARQHGADGLVDAPVTVNLKGSAGQSFGVWNAAGLNMSLEGDANDYVAKGMSGGRISINSAPNTDFIDADSVIIGNTCLYGATGGQLFASGNAGERFAVRNSGALAVVEGVGDHGCEYMTGGVVCVLGETGVNFGAGMTGGFAFVLDENRRFIDRYNHELIDICRLMPEAMESHAQYLQQMIEQHYAATNSVFAKQILENFSDYLPKFWLVKPKASDLDMLIDALSSGA